MNILLKLTILLAGISATWELSAHVYGHGSNNHAHEEKSVSTFEHVLDLLQSYSHSSDDKALEQAEIALNALVRANRLTTLQIGYARAWLLQARHQFAEAGTLVATLRRYAPGSVEMALLHANLLRIQGKNDLALQACNAVAGLQVTTGLLCNAQVSLTQRSMRKPDASERAHSSQRIKQIRLALEKDSAVHREPEIQAWAYGVMADLYLANAELDAGLSFARLAHKTDPSCQRLTALADALLAQGRTSETLELIAPDTTVPGLVLARLLALKQRSDPELIRLSAVVDKQFKANIAENDWLHAREMARFYIDVHSKPELARLAAEKNWEIQKEAEDFDLLVRVRSSDTTARAVPATL
ncbi:MAG: hypothetical protein NXH85_17200 [Pseudomonadaceae bacterium]|nr:hypothetical protein [Pseudomonadaceae bacterium]